MNGKFERYYSQGIIPAYIREQATTDQIRQELGIPKNSAERFKNAEENMKRALILQKAREYRQYPVLFQFPTPLEIAAAEIVDQKIKREGDF